MHFAPQLDSLRPVKVLLHGWYIWRYISLSTSAAPHEPPVVIKFHDALVAQMMKQILFILNILVIRLNAVQCHKF